MIRVFVNGTFDLLHPGHVLLLKHARSRGDWLRVAIDSDLRVRRLKGMPRPIMTSQERRLVLRELRCVDEVVVFDTDAELIQAMLGFDIMIKGSDYRDQYVIGQESGIKIEFFDRVDAYSTTNTLAKIHADS
jgi:D-beta-D-heptose 7-phosphate kinase/D-beta-D-heptose 1-phosphate adenosyltransferase